jgi:uncharacterized protein involved in exopolysaccharide biosynthesis
MDDGIVSDEVGSMGLREFFAMLRRRRWQIALVIGVLGSMSLFIAIVLPSMYRSSATILVQEQEVPPDLVRSTITSFADERIQVISHQVMTRTVLLKLVEKYGLYARYRDRLTDEEILDRMRKDIKLTTVNADISDRSSGRRVNATIAFKISFDAPNPDRAQAVVNELVELYLDENVKARQQSVAETNAFLAQEADRVGKQIEDIEARLAEFKRRNVGRMPDSSSVNVQLADRTESEVQRVERDISMLQARKLSLEAQLPLLKRNNAVNPPAAAGGDRGAQTPEGRLRTLQAQYATVSAIYGADHPDVRRLQREIASLKAQTGVSDAGAVPSDVLQQREAQLAALKKRYGDDHPDVQAARRALDAAKAADARAAPARKAEDANALDGSQASENPAYAVLAAQLDSTTRELGQLVALRDDLRAKQRTYDSRLLQIPEVEREYSQLTRDYANAQTHYREIRTKQMQAEGAMELEKDSKAERFTLSEPANRPQTPFVPNRPMIALFGLVVSVTSGFGFAWLREAFDTTVKGPLELARLTRVPLLTAIPYIETPEERVRNRWRMWAVGLLCVIAAGAFLAGVHVFGKPLPALFDAVVRKFAIW